MRCKQGDESTLLAIPYCCRRMQSLAVCLRASCWIPRASKQLQNYLRKKSSWVNWQVSLRLCPQRLHVASKKLVQCGWHAQSRRPRAKSWHAQSTRWKINCEITCSWNYHVVCLWALKLLWQRFVVPLENHVYRHLIGFWCVLLWPKFAILYKLTLLTTYFLDLDKVKCIEKDCTLNWWLDGCLICCRCQWTCQWCAKIKQMSWYCYYHNLGKRSQNRQAKCACPSHPSLGEIPQGCELDVR